MSTRTPWEVLAASVTRLSDRVNATPQLREATVAAVSPLSVLFDTDTAPTLVFGSLSGRMNLGDRVLTVKLKHYVWIIGRKEAGNLGYPTNFQLPSAVSNGGIGSVAVEGEKVAFTGAYTARLTELFAGANNDQRSVFEIFWMMENSPAAVSSGFMLGLSSGVTAIGSMRSTFFTQTTGTATLPTGGSAADTQNALVIPEGTAAVTGFVLHAFIYNALRSAERTKIEYEVSSDASNGAKTSGFVYNTSISLDDGLRLGSTNSARLWDGVLYCKKVV